MAQPNVITGVREESWWRVGGFRVGELSIFEILSSSVTGLCPDLQIPTSAPVTMICSSGRTVGLVTFHHSADLHNSIVVSLPSQ